MKKRETSLLALFMAALLLLPAYGWAQSRPSKVKPLVKPGQVSGLSKLRNRAYHSPRLMTIPEPGSVIQTPLKVRNVEGETITLYGAVCYNRDWYSQYTTNTMPYGVYSFPVQENFPLTPIVVGEAGAMPNYGAYITPTTYGYVTYHVDDSRGYGSLRYLAYNLSDGSQIKAQCIYDVTLMSSASAYDPTTGKLYACLFNANQDGYNFGTLDYDNMSSTVVRSNIPEWIAMAFNSKGVLYAIDLNGMLNTVNLETGETTQVGYIGFKPTSDIQSAAFDMSNDKLYYAGCNNEVFNLYEVDTTTGAATRILPMKGTQLAALYIPYKEAVDGAPARAIDLRGVFDGASTTGNVHFQVPTTTYDGKALSGDVNYTVDANGTTVATGSAASGATVDAPVEAKSGLNDFTVILSNAAGESPRAHVSQWVGYDKPATVGNLQLTIDDTTREAKVSWTAPQTGVHKGYIDNDGLTYKVVRYPGGETVSEGQKTTSFTETLPGSSMTIYSYGVVAVNGDQQSDEARTDEKVLGSAYDVPYNEPFDTQTAFSVYKVVDNNKDGSTWHYDTDVKAASSKFNEDNAADDYLLTPPIKMKAGHVYTFSANIYDADYANYYRQRFEVCFGLSDENVLDYDVVINPTELKQYDPKERFTVAVTADADGEYRFAIHDISDKNQAYLTVDNISVTEAGTTAVPDSVSKLTFTPGERGNLTASLTFNAPTTDVKGESLKSLSKIEVYRNDSVLVKTFDAPQPGSRLSVTDDAPANGINHYTVRAFNEAGAGLVASARGYIGQDRPLDPSHVGLSDANDQVALSWDAPSVTGPYGGYVRTDELRYNLYNNNEYGDLSLAYSDVKGTSKTLDVDNTGTQRMIYWGVMAENDFGRSNTIVSPSLVVGDAYPLPFHEGFPKGNPENDLWWMTTNPTNGNTWGFGNDQSSDGDGCYIGWYPYTAGASCSLNSGKISLKGTKNPVLSFDYWAIPGVDAQLSILVNTGDTTNVKLQTIDYKTLQGDLSSQGWRRAYVNLPANDKYVVIKFLATSNNTDAVVGIDNISVRDVRAHDLSATLKAPTTVNRGDNNSYTVSVTNVGSETMDNYKVNFFVNGALTASQDGEVLQRDASKDYTFTYAAPVNGEGDLRVYAVVESNNDEDPSNNTTSTVAVSVKASESKTITDLTAQTENNNVTLQWTPVAESRSVTEDFESYTPFVWSETFGPWKTVDHDGADSYNVWEMSSNPVAGDEKPDAFTIFNPSAYTEESEEGTKVGVDLIGSPWLTPHSGNQYAGDLCSQSGKNDDWLISPALSGNSQTISFFTKAYYSDYTTDVEKYEILYSTTDTATTSFTLLASDSIVGTNDADWHEVSYTLPEGAKYFAIRCVTEDMYLFMVDDITYEVGGGKRIGFRVYRDGERIAELPGTATSYVDSNVSAGKHTYNVTTLYDSGESGFSNDAVTDITTGINSIEADGASKDIYNLGGAKVSKPHHGVYIIGNKKVVKK